MITLTLTLTLTKPRTLIQPNRCINPTDVSPVGRTRMLTLTIAITSRIALVPRGRTSHNELVR